MPVTKLDQKSLYLIRRMFIAALIGGVFGVCLPQFYNFPLLAVFIPMTCMGLYTWVGYLFSRNTLFLEQFGDSVYYLGFLLTLVALVISLYFYQGGDTLKSGLLISNFSLALLTTIFGLSVRIYINNFKVDIRSAETHMMTEIEYAANELIRKAKIISMQLDVSHKETQIAIKSSIEHAAEGIHQTALTVQDYAKSGAIALNKNIQEANQSVKNATQAFEKNLLDIKLPEEIFSDKLSRPLDRLVIRLDEMQFQLKKINERQDTIDRNAQNIAVSMNQTVTDLHLFSDSINGFNQKLNANANINESLVSLLNEVSSLSEKTIGISENLTRQTEQSSEAMHNFTKLVSAVNSLPNELETMSFRINQSSAQVSETFKTFGDNTQSGVKIGQDLQDIASALGNTKETITQISEFGLHVTSTLNRLESFNGMIAQHTQLLSDMGGVARLDIDLAKEHQVEMSKILQKSRKSLLHMQQDFAQGANNISKILDT